MELGLRQAWAYSVANLGLDPYFGPKYVTLDVATLDFHRLKSSLYPTQGASVEPTASSWLGISYPTQTFWAHGGWNGSEVLTGIPFQQVTHRHGIGEDARTEVRDEPRTVIGARIDPPLLLGFYFARPSDLLSSGFASLDPQRASALLAPMTNDGSDVAAQVANATAVGMRVRITDSAVFVVADEVHARDLRALLDGTALIAQRLAYARGRLPASAAEQAILGAWGTLAQMRALALDPARFTLSGNFSGYAVTAALYVLDGRYHTDVRVRLARPLTEIASLEIRRPTTGDKLFGWLAGDAVDIGDGSLLVHGSPAIGVRAALPPATRPHVHALLASAHAVSVKADMLWAHFLAPLDAAQLDRAFAEVVALAAIITPTAPTAPYR